MTSHFSASNLLTDVRYIAETLQRASFAHDDAFDKAALFAAAAAKLPHSDQPIALFVPGRLELLGKHTDYAGGRSIVATVERGFCAVATPRSDNLFNITDSPTNDHASFRISPDLPTSPGHWSNYPKTVARRLARNFPGPLNGLDLAFASDLPPASGLASSSAFVIASFFAIAHANQLFRRPEYAANLHNHEDLAAYLAAIENGQSFRTLSGDSGVGTLGGSEDHAAILTSHPRQLRQYSYCPLRFEQSIPLPSNFTFAIATSGVPAEKTGPAMQKYNHASLLAQTATDKWNAASNRSDPHLAAAIQSSPDAIHQLRNILADSQDLLDRFEHFLAESTEIVPAAATALVNNNIPALSSIVDRSQHLAETILRNQVPETMHLARSARQLGSPAASAFGAGFGGSVWALIDMPSAPKFLSNWQSAYHAAFPNHANASFFFLTRPGPAAARLFA